MQKQYFLPFLLCLIFGLPDLATAQVIPSDCEVTPEAAFHFQSDAEKIALREIYANGTGDTSSILIPEAASAPFLQSLAAIYNAAELPARKDIVQLYNIHAEGDPITQAFSLYIDTSYAWAKHWLDFELHTGHEIMDQLVAEYQLSFLLKPHMLKELIDGQNYLVVSLVSSLNLNLPALFTEICNVDGVASAAHNVRFSNEYIKDITFTEMGNYKEFLFKYGWGDCDNAVCNYFHYWKFKVFEDCSVEFSGDFGDLLSTSELQHVLKFDFFPNPATDKLNLAFVGPPQTELTYTLYNAVGNHIASDVLKTGNGNVQKELSLEYLNAGFYFISIYNGSQVFTKKIVKK